MNKKITAFFLVFFISAAANAGPEGIVVATIDRSHGVPEVRTTLPRVNERYEYYNIEGSSEQELRNQMCLNGCKWCDGKTYDAVTNWHVTWDYDHAQSENGCSAGTFRANVDITIRLPRWTRSNGASSVLVEKWGRYLEKLLEHEQGHRDLAVSAAADIAESVASLPPASDCSHIDREIIALSRERLRKLNADSEGYDKATRHGVTQGAIFP